MSQDTTIISLLGKDYLNVAEAAFYCGVSESQFRKQLSKNVEWQELAELKIMGKKVYRVQDLRRKIEQINSGVKLPKKLTACR